MVDFVPCDRLLQKAYFALSTPGIYFVLQPFLIDKVTWRGPGKGSEGTHKRRRPVRRTPKELENAAIFLQLPLPSTLIRHENGAFRKHFSHQRNLRTPAFFWKSVENGFFFKER